MDLVIISVWNTSCIHEVYSWYSVYRQYHPYNNASKTDCKRTTQNINNKIWHAWKLAKSFPFAFLFLSNYSMHDLHIQSRNVAYGNTLKLHSVKLHTVCEDCAIKTYRAFSTTSAALCFVINYVYNISTIAVNIWTIDTHLVFSDNSIMRMQQQASSDHLGEFVCLSVQG